MTFTPTSASRTRSSATRGLSSALTELRTAKHLSVYAVCKRTALSRSVLEAAEADADGTKYGVLFVLAEFYGVKDKKTRQPSVAALIALGEDRATEMQAAS